MWYTSWKENSMLVDPRQEWQTPDDFWNILDTEFHFDLDAAASPHNARCKKYYTAEQDSLSDSCPWITADTHRVFINPGFSEIGPWCAKALREVEKDEAAVVVIISLISPSTGWWMKYATQAAVIRLIGGRRIQFRPAGGIRQSSNARENCILIFEHSSKNQTMYTWDWTK